VHLAKLLRRGGNVLLLDEPTNDLDVDTLRALEEALLAFPGCAVIISHDRWFLDRVATHVLAFEELRGLRGAPPRAARRRGRPAAPDLVQEAHARLTRIRVVRALTMRRDGNGRLDAQLPVQP
jgi:ABC-type sulfate/molybdate transport systems ATPase subunit